jgi:hypothetical protein
MIRVRQVSAEHRVLAPADQLSDAVRPPKHASVGVNAHDDHIIDPMLLQQRE